VKDSESWRFERQPFVRANRGTVGCCRPIWERGGAQPIAETWWPESANKSVEREALIAPVRTDCAQLKEKTTQMQPNQLRAILIFQITPTKTWQFAGYPYTTGTQKAAKVSNKNSSFNWANSILTGSMNASHSTNPPTNSWHHTPTNSQAPPHSHTNPQHPTIPPLAPTTGQRSKSQPSKYFTFHLYQLVW